MRWLFAVEVFLVKVRFPKRCLERKLLTSPRRTDVEPFVMVVNHCRCEERVCDRT
jgi:hypothetical protein